MVESSKKRFMLWISTRNPDEKIMAGISKGNMVRSLRAFWLSTHIILVSIFFVMLGVHIFLAYFY